MKTVAVIGASPDRHKFGNKALRAFRAAGYRAIPINPRHRLVEGEKAYPTVLDYPHEIDMATVYVPPNIGARVVESLA
jgi:predicted CoA-binding protein